MSRMFRRICGAGNGNLRLCGGSVIAQDAAHSDVRGVSGLDSCQHLPLYADEAAAIRKPCLLNIISLKNDQGVAQTPLLLGKKLSGKKQEMLAGTGRTSLF